MKQSTIDFWTKKEFTAYQIVKIALISSLATILVYSNAGLLGWIAWLAFIVITKKIGQKMEADILKQEVE